MNNGLIVSIQNYSLQTTQELAEKAIRGGAVAIRTDQPIKIPLPVIGLKKLYEKKYYMTNDPSAINQVMKYADYVAIDCRKGNDQIDLIVSHCHVNNYKYIADIETRADYINLRDLCNQNKLIFPSYVATTFNVFNSETQEDLVLKLSAVTKNIIVEGGISKTNDVYFFARHNNVTNVCIGAAIGDFEKNTKNFSKEFLCC